MYTLHINYAVLVKEETFNDKGNLYLVLAPIRIRASQTENLTVNGYSGYSDFAQ